MEDQLAEAALAYHPGPGKITVQPTKDMTNKRDLSLAYSPERGRKWIVTALCLGGSSRKAFLQ